MRIAQPSGLTVVGALVRQQGDAWHAEHATVYRTARRLMEGTVYARAAAVKDPQQEEKDQPRVTAQAPDRKE